MECIYHRPGIECQHMSTAPNGQPVCEVVACPVFEDYLKTFKPAPDLWCADHKD